MDGSNPKVSFIPKGSLVKEDSFLERRRPTSIIGFVAAIVFVASAGSYAALYYLNNSLSETIATKKTEIEKAKEEFDNATEVNEARVFRARADLARELLNTHRVTSPIFTFLSDNTTQSIMYEKFSFKMSPEGPVVELSGEAPSYAVLAYQADVLKSKNSEISNFSISDMSLTKFGTIKFSLELAFRPDHLLYTKNLATKRAENEKENVANMEAKPVEATSTKKKAETEINTAVDQMESPVIGSEVIYEELPKEGGVDNVVVDRQPIAEVSTDRVEGPSILRQLWSKFKFW